MGRSLAAQERRWNKWVDKKGTVDQSIIDTINTNIAINQIVDTNVEPNQIVSNELSDNITINQNTGSVVNIVTNQRNDHIPVNSNSEPKGTMLNPDWNLREHGIEYHYWYSVGDMMIILHQFRSQYLKYSIPEWMDDNIDLGDLYSAYRMNNERIFLSEPYSEENIEISLMNDFLRIYNEWGEKFPYQFMFLLIAQSHWRLVRIIFNDDNSIDILWNDPFSSNT